MAERRSHGYRRARAGDLLCRCRSWVVRDRRDSFDRARAVARWYSLLELRAGNRGSHRRVAVVGSDDDESRGRGTATRRRQNRRALERPARHALARVPAFARPLDRHARRALYRGRRRWCDAGRHGRDRDRNAVGHGSRSRARRLGRSVARHRVRRAARDARRARWFGRRPAACSCRAPDTSARISRGCWSTTARTWRSPTSTPTKPQPSASGWSLRTRRCVSNAM